MSRSARHLVRRRALLHCAAAAVLGAAAAGCTDTEPDDRGLTPVGTEPVVPSLVTTTTIKAAPASTAPRRSPEDTISEASELFANREIEFEEIVVHEQLRVAQTEQDTKGALFRSYEDGWSPTNNPPSGYDFTDLCNVPDVRERAWAILNLEKEPSLAQVQWLEELIEAADCSGIDGSGENRWLWLKHGQEVRVFRTEQEAHDGAIREVEENTLPRFSVQLGFGHSGWFGGSDGYGIRYSPVDEVGVVAGSVSVLDGALRGLVRNRSRTLWAYGVRVRAGGRSWSWPLSVQPGEVAPFEFDDWDGPANGAGIGFEVDAELSNDADLSRSFEFLPLFESTDGSREDFSGWLPADLDGELAVDAPRALTVALVPMSSEFEVSHPSLGGLWAPGVIESLRGFVAQVDPDGRVAEVSAITPFHAPGHSYRGRTDDGPLVAMPTYPPPDSKPVAGPPYVNFAFAIWPDTDWMFWIGGAHPPSG